jgi:Thiamine pyrophosphate enzyme, central domain
MTMLVRPCHPATIGHLTLLILLSRQLSDRAIVHAEVVASGTGAALCEGLYWVAAVHRMALCNHMTLGIACRPLFVVGKGAALSQADTALRQLVDATGLPFLATAMGRGVVPDSHPGAVNAARSKALRGADVALIFGARCDHVTEA